MDWTQQFDGYCQRTDFTYWSEPVNALTNLAFVLAAIWMWNRSGPVRPAQVQCAILFAIGVGSFLFHTHATAWAAATDVIPIGLFILVYLFLANRDFVGMPWWGALIGTALYLPYAFVMVPILDALPFFHISNFYWTVPILLFGYGAALRRRKPDVARGLVSGGALLCVSITLRSLDETLCPHLPTGTHYLWHILNAVMLGWMIEVYVRFQRRTVPPSAAAKDL